MDRRQFVGAASAAGVLGLASGCAAVGSGAGGKVVVVGGGYGGATALDFTLPVIQKSGGIQVVPVAIVSGFILSLLGPILILGFLAI